MTAPRILILRGGAIGDFILTLPAIRALRKRWPEAYIEVTGYPHIANLALATGLADKITSLDSAGVAHYFSLAPGLQEDQKSYVRSFDIIISYLYDPSSTVKTNLITAGAKHVIYGSPMVENTHAVEHLFKPLESLAIYPEKSEYPQLKLKKDNIANGRERIKKIGNKVIAIHPGSGSPKKNWPIEKFLELSDKLTRETIFSPMLITGEADSEIEHTVQKEKRQIPVLSGCSLVELAETLSACHAYMGNDSGITHIAASLGIPVVALYGPTDSRLWGLRCAEAQIIQSRKPTTESLAAISTEQVYNTLIQHLASLKNSICQKHQNQHNKNKS
ncbi:glycosyltransferase family 9 protein [Verrucomicrobiota bacterium]